MSSSTSGLQQIINEIASQVPLLDKQDLTPLTQIIAGMEKISATDGAPPALRSMAKRGAALAEHIIMEETEFEPGCDKLRQCIEKMSRSIDEVAGADENETPETEVEEPPETPGETQAEAVSSDDDMEELLKKFASQQNPVLEDLEAYVLELEKGNPNARDAVKRLLHTWKGEFGVLDLGDYSGLIHDVEQELAEDRCGTEQLFRLKDFLQERLGGFAEGRVRPVSEQDRASLLDTGVQQSTGDAQPPATAEAAAGVQSEEHEEVPTAGERAFEGDPSLMGDFVTESRDHIQAAEPLLLDLETDPTNADSLNSIFRSFHTIKGVAGFLGLKEVSSLSHSMENVMDLARKGNLLLQPAHVDLMLESVDCLKEFITAVESAGSGGTYRIPDSYSSVMQRLASPGEIAGDEPGGVAPGGKVGEILVASGSATREQVEHGLKRQQAGDTRRLGEILIEKGEVRARSVGSALASQQSTKRTSSVQETVRVPVERLDALVDAIGEAVIAQSMIAGDGTVQETANQELQKKLARADTIMHNVQELSMSLRMVSVKSTFQKMARLVRDLAKKSGKDVEFVTDGEETELDKSVVEHIGDPLLHMIRNAVDHGIEDAADDRVKAGKPARARVCLSAFHKAGSIYIEIEDDGRGLDKDAIRAKAVKQGLCREEDRFSDQEIFQFIFNPGFSTAKKVTDVSGRGVGMDVVKKNIQRLRGSVEIKSEPGKGSTFSIRLPLTLAIIDGMIVRLHSQRYIVPTLSVLESMMAVDKRIDTIAGRGEVVDVRGQLIRLIRLADIFGLNGKNGSNGHEGVVMIVEDMLGKTVALLVDEILGRQQVVIKNLGKGVGDVPGVSGGAIMGDGSVNLILDVGGIVRVAGE